jgi:hypothetical protein
MPWLAKNKFPSTSFLCPPGVLPLTYFHFIRNVMGDPGIKITAEFFSIGAGLPSNTKAWLCKLLSDGFLLLKNNGRHLKY